MKGKNYVEQLLSLLITIMPMVSNSDFYSRSYDPGASLIEWILTLPNIYKWLRSIFWIVQEERFGKSDINVSPFFDFFKTIKPKMEYS